MTARPRPYRRFVTDWRIWSAVAFTALITGGATTDLVFQAKMRAQLVCTDPDAIPKDAALTAFAVALARPAYRAHCAACHGADLTGDPRQGAPNLTDRDWLYGDGRVTDIEQTVLYGIRAGNGRTRDLADMPAFGRAVPYRRYEVASLEPDEIHDVVEFLLAATEKPADTAAAERGATIFAGKGQCFDCHEEDAQGNNAIGAPNLTDGIWLRGNGSRSDIADTVSRGLSDFCPAWFGQLNLVTIRALAVLVYTASHRQSPAAKDG